MSIQEFSVWLAAPPRWPRGMSLQEFSVRSGHVSGAPFQHQQAVGLGLAAIGGGPGGTPLAARPPASGCWSRRMSLQEFSADTSTSGLWNLTRAQPVKWGLAPPTPQGRPDQDSVQIHGGPVGAGKHPAPSPPILLDEFLTRLGDFLILKRQYSHFLG